MVWCWCCDSCRAGVGAGGATCVGDGRGTGDGMVVVVVVQMLVLESSSLGHLSSLPCAWVVVGSRGCSSWSGRHLPHNGIDQKPNSPKTIWMLPWPGTSRLKAEGPTLS